MVCRFICLFGAIAALGGILASAGLAAEFRGINAETIVGRHFDRSKDTIVSITAITGDGRALGGHSFVTNVNFGCAAIVCGIAPFTLSLGEARQLDNLAPFNEFVIDNASNFDVLVHADALSHDGSTALLGGYNTESYLFDGATTTRLEETTGLSFPVRGVAMSASGRTIVGNSGETPFLWRPFGGAREIVGLPDEFDMTVVGISGDGHSVLINAQPGITHGNGWLNPNAPRGNAMVWTDDATLTELPPLGGDAYSTALAVSFDGAAVVGNSVINATERLNPGRAVRWENGQVEPLDDLATFSFSNASDVTADGRLIVGQAYNLEDPTLSPEVEIDPEAAIPFWTPVGRFPFGFAYEVAHPARAVLWDASGAVFDLRELLVDRYGLEQELAGWQLTNASVISDDGLVIAGRGVDPEGNLASWAAVLSVPEPTTCCLAIVVTALAYLRRGPIQRS